MPLIAIVALIPYRCVFVILARKGVYANHSHDAPPIEIVGVSRGLAHPRGVWFASRPILNSAERPPSFRLSVRASVAVRVSVRVRDFPSLVIQSFRF